MHNNFFIKKKNLFFICRFEFVKSLVKLLALNFHDISTGHT